MVGSPLRPRSTLLLAACAALLLAGPAAAGPVLPITIYGVIPDANLGDDGTPPTYEFQCSDGSLGLHVTYMGQDNQLCAFSFPGGLCVVDSYNQHVLIDATCVDDNGSGNPCLSHYDGGDDANLSDRTCVDTNDDGYSCVSHYVDAAAQARLCFDRDATGAQCPTLYAQGGRVDRTCVLDHDDRGFPCLSNYSGDGSMVGRLCLDDDGDASHTCATAYALGAQANRACNEPNPSMILCASDLALGTVADRTCVGTYPDGFCVAHSVGVGLDVVEDRVCTTTDDQSPTATCVANNLYLDGNLLAQDRTCEGPYAEGDPCVAHRATVLGRSVETRACATPNLDTGKPCVAATVYLDGVPQVAPARCLPTVEQCADPQFGVVVDGEQHCVDNPCPEPVGTPGPGQVAVVCGKPVDDPCPQSVDPGTASACGVGPACPGGVVGSPGPGEVAVVCGTPVPQPCPQSIDPATASACGTVLCPTGVVGSPGPGEAAVVCGTPVPNPCPTPIGPPNPGQVAQVCGVPIQDPCPQGADPTTASACGTVLCPTGVVGTPGPGQALVVCGTPVNNPCPQGVDPTTAKVCAVGPLCPGGVTSPPGPGQVAVVCGTPVPNPCPTPIGPPGPGTLGSVCGVPVNDPCPQGVDSNTAKVCLVGPLCPGGLTSPAGPGQVAVVCGNPVAQPCAAGVDPTTASVCGTTLCPSGVVGTPGPGERAKVCGVGVPDPVPGGLVPECMDGADNDGDGRADFRPMAVGGGDSGCTNPLDDES